MKEKNLWLRIYQVVPAHPFGKGGWSLGSAEDKTSSWESERLSMPLGKEFECLVLNLKFSPVLHKNIWRLNVFYFIRDAIKNKAKLLILHI